MKPAIVFDLDGTLVDSAPGILAAFAGAFAACGLTPQLALSSALIGPPLPQTLAKLAGTDDAAILKPLLEAFKANYDEQSYRLTTVFPGVNEMLAELMAQAFDLHIATNKRILPTRKILKHLNWTQYFLGVYALDTFDPPLPSKSHMLGEILRLQKFKPQHTWYIGDRQEDGAAAHANAMPFLLAGWGYDELTADAWQKLATPMQLLETLRADAGQ